MDFTSLRSFGVKAVSGGAWLWPCASGRQVPVESVSTDLEESVVNFVNEFWHPQTHLLRATAMLKTRAALAKIADVADAGVGK